MFAVAPAAESKKRLASFQSGTLALPIAGPGTVANSIKVEKRGRIKDLDVALRLDHDVIGELTVALTPPAGATPITLAANRGGMGHGFGFGVNDCGRAGHTTFALFDDEGFYPLPSGDTDPLYLDYRPETPLSAVDRSKMSGTWTLSVTDQTVENSGELGCWRMYIRYRKK